MACKVVLDRISKLESDHVAMKVVLYDFRKQGLSVQQYFNLFDGKLDDLNTEAKDSIVERLERLTKIKDVATNAHPDSMLRLIKENIELKMRKQEPIRDSATVTIKLVEAEIYAI